MIYETIQSLEDERHITPEECAAALRAEESGDDGHTIGYELEVLYSAAKQLPIVSHDKIEAQIVCDANVARYGFRARAEAHYELQSPPARHPLPLAIATRGLANAGWLPYRNHGVVNAHVSIGTERVVDKYDQSDQTRLITLLRSVEQLGTTTANRLLLPVRQSVKEEVAFTHSLIGSWASKGSAGVDVTHPDETIKRSENWHGDSTRIEFRTLGYYSPEQFGRTLDMVYYLTRGLFAKPGSALQDIYTEFEGQLDQYFNDHGLTTLEEEWLYEVDVVYDLDKYMQPYAEHLLNADKSVLRAFVHSAVEDLKEELGMQGLDVTMADAA
jgi:hypothetical protein